MTQPSSSTPARQPGVFEVTPGPATFSQTQDTTDWWLEREARRLGFARVGCIPAHDSNATLPAFSRWLAAGYHGAMRYLEQPRRAPSELLPGAKTVVVGVVSYGAAHLNDDEPIAAYARGDDYHVVLKRQLRALAQSCADHLGRRVRARACVDTAPLLERAWAERAGVAFVGKSTLAITPGVGSATLLGELLLDVELPFAEPPPLLAGCGSCRRCLDACPTQAFTSAYSLDARRCISYLTIELRSAIPRELRPMMGQLTFGCDICQRVCPYNWSRKLPDKSAELGPARDIPSPERLLNMTSGDHKRLVRGTALSRASRPQLQRNAAVALGNGGDPASVPSLAAALTQNPSALVRAHAAWALGQIGGSPALDTLTTARERESDEQVLEEISNALVAAQRSR